MKKVIGIFIVMFFMSNFNFAKSTEVIPRLEDCEAYAFTSTNAEEDEYGAMTFEEWVATFAWYYNFCEESEGVVLSPVFL